jgi:hypothetical protein
MMSSDSDEYKREIHIDPPNFSRVIIDVEGAVTGYQLGDDAESQAARDYIASRIAGMESRNRGEISDQIQA